MRYVIVANPVAGSCGPEAKSGILGPAADLLDAEIIGLDTTSKEEFTECAGRAAADVIVVAGGDGTFSDIVNAVELDAATLAYIPLGSGNALRHALGIKGKTVLQVAERILKSNARRVDLVECDGSRLAFMAGLGYSARVVRKRDELRALGRKGFLTYARACFSACFTKGARFDAEVLIDGRPFEKSGLLEVALAVQPFFGYGMKVFPDADFGDGQLHVNLLGGGMFSLARAAAGAFTFGNRVGKVFRCEELEVSAGLGLPLQIDGDFAGEADKFKFRVLPGALKLKI